MMMMMMMMLEKRHTYLFGIENVSKLKKIFSLLVL